MKTKRLLALALALVMVFCLCSCGSKDNTEQPDGAQTTPSDNGTVNEDTSHIIGNGEVVAKDELIVGTTNEVSIPFDNMTNSNINGIALCYDFLVYLDNVTGELKSDILDEWYYEDETTIVMKVKDGVTFSNGMTLTAEDIVWSFAARLATGQPQTDDFKNFDWDNAVISDDGLTLTVKTFEPYAPGLTVLSSKSIECKAQHEQYSEDSDFWWNNTCGTGPYYLIEQVDGAYATYALRDDYWGDEEYMFKNVTMKHYGEETALYIDYQNGNVDIAMNLGAYSYEQLKAGAVDNTVVRLQGQGNYDQLHANPATVEAWNDVNFRLAVAHAIDWDSLAIAAYDGLAKPCDSIFTSTCVGYESQGIYEYDPDLSRQLLEQAGYGDGITLELLTRDRNSALAEALQGMLAEVGINLDLSIVEFGVLIPKMSAGECDFLLTDVNTDNLGEPSSAYGSFGNEANLPSQKITDAHWNELTASASKIIDTDERVAVLQEIQEYAHEQCFFIPLMERCEVWCFNTTVLPSDFNCYYGGVTNFAVVAD